ncbi:MAG TPA: hypothetical protein VMW24_23705, partial [Sedimentisphaerales bacterium]|nr:hypothetical protein [Sedimentisphaerales bacterium]
AFVPEGDYHETQSRPYNRPETERECLMWIVPRNSRFSRFVPATAASNSDWPGHWRTLCASLLWRSKPSPWPTWKQRLRRVPWLSTLCGRICDPSLQSDFEDALISSLAATRASRSVRPASGPGPTTPDTFGRILQRSCQQFSLFGASSRMSPDTCPLDSPPFIEAYESWATKLRRDCLMRASAALPTNGCGCSSWSTANVPNRGPELDKSHRPESGGIDLQSAVQKWPTPNQTDYKGESQPEGRRPTCDDDLPSRVNRMFPTPAAANYRDGKASPATMARNSRPLQEFIVSGPPLPASPSTNGKNQGLLWMTPEALNQMGYQVANGKRYPRLGRQVKMFTTPCSDDTSQRKAKYKQGGTALSLQTKGKLNNGWVSQLQGLPPHWTRP